MSSTSGTDQEKHFEAYVKLTTVLFDKAKAYTNLIIIAGYAAFFTMWSFIRSILSEKVMIWAALCMIVSACIFVFFEVYKMIWNAVVIRRRLMLSPEQPDILKHMKIVESIELEEGKIFGRVWVFILIATIFSAIFAIGFLVYSLVVGLISRL